MVSFISRVICHSVGRSSFCALALLLLFASCDKDDVAEYPAAPEISLLSLSHDTIRQYEDELIIRIGYKDGDGDLGFEDPEKYALFVRDIRLAEFDGFYVGPLAPPNVKVPIQGELTINFPSLFLFGNGNLEQTRFEVKMIDRAGHESNLLETGIVTIARQ